MGNEAETILYLIENKLLSRLSKKDRKKSYQFVINQLVVHSDGCFV